MAKKLSIIVPVYNVEKYLERCIRSIVMQDAPTGSYELLAVNDGSTDGSRDILVRLKEEYPFIQIIDKENGGLSSARNAGIEQATGDYFFFIDSDDWIADGALCFLLDWIEKFPVDVLMFGAVSINDAGKQVSLVTHFSPNDRIISAEDYSINYTIKSSAWMSLFSRRLLYNCRIRMKEGFLSEDDDFIVRIFSMANQVVCNNKTIYYYYQRPESISNSTNSKHNKKLLNDKLLMLAELKDYIRQFRGKRKQGLERKLNFLAVDIILELMRKNMPANVIDAVLHQLKQTGYYPLPKAAYSWKYRLFRLLFYYPFAVKVFKGYV